MAWSMLGPVACWPLEASVAPVQSEAMPASWLPVLAAALFKPSSTLTWLVRSTPIGPALVKAESVGRNPPTPPSPALLLRGVTAAAAPVGGGPYAPHIGRTTPHEV